jgi:tetratricopeptide (TPR) repeat protein
MVYSRYGLLIQVLFQGYTHNLPLTIWMGQGLLGLIAFAGLVITFYLFVYRVVRSASPRQVFHGAWLGVTATLIHGLFDARQYVESAWLMPVLFILIGLAVATGRLALEQAALEDRYIKLSYIPRFVPITALAALVVIPLILNRQVVAAWNTNIGALEETRGELMPDLSAARQTAYYEAAQRYYREALASDHDWPNANRRLGNLNVKMEQFADAVSPLETAATEEPANPAAVKGLGLAYVWVGRTEDAARTLQQLKDPQAMIEELGVWGFFRSEQQKYLLSAYAYETAQLMAAGTVNINGWLLIADTYRRADDRDRARWWYEQVLIAEPENETARNALDDIDNAT